MEEYYGTDPEDYSDYPLNEYAVDSDYDNVGDLEEKFYGTDPNNTLSSPDRVPEPGDSDYTDHNSNDEKLYEFEEYTISTVDKSADKYADNSIGLTVDKLKIGGKTRITFYSSSEYFEGLGGYWFMGTMEDFILYSNLGEDQEWQNWGGVGQYIFLNKKGNQYIGYILIPEFLPGSNQQEYTILAGYYDIYTGTTRINHVTLEEGESKSTISNEKDHSDIFEINVMGISIQYLLIILIVVIVIIASYGAVKTRRKKKIMYGDMKGGKKKLTRAEKKRLKLQAKMAKMAAKVEAMPGVGAGVAVPTIARPPSYAAPPTPTMPATQQQYQPGTEPAYQPPYRQQYPYSPEPELKPPQTSGYEPITQPPTDKDQYGQALGWGTNTQDGIGIQPPNQYHYDNEYPPYPASPDLPTQPPHPRDHAIQSYPPPPPPPPPPEQHPSRYYEQSQQQPQYRPQHQPQYQPQHPPQHTQDDRWRYPPKKEPPLQYY